MVGERIKLPGQSAHRSACLRMLLDLGLATSVQVDREID
jgi:hypothetical protein